MTILISERDWVAWEEEVSQRIEYLDPEDSRDRLFPQPTWLTQGYTREISLRNGLKILISDFRVRDRTKLASEEEPVEWVDFHCHLSGDHQDIETKVGNLEYGLYGSGTALKRITTCSGQFPILEVEVSMSPEVLLDFTGDQGALPPELRHLIGNLTQPGYTRVGTLSPMMQRVLWQIIRCPYLGMMKRMYLESKALELAMLMLQQEQEIRQGQRSLRSLKPDEVNRIHHAREILLQNLDQPPSLMELARRVSLNDSALKRGFRQVFGKPVFSYLLDYRMEQARQLLMSGELKVGEVMQRVGLHNRQYFAAAFRKKFGTNPRDYLRSDRKNTR
jgi:AraC-like DNA-binding protein